MEVNAQDYGFAPTDTPRTDRSVSVSTLSWFIYILKGFSPQVFVLDVGLLVLSARKTSPFIILFPYSIY